MATEATGTNQAGNLYGLSTLCPIKIGNPEGERRSHEAAVRAILAELPAGHRSPLAKVDNTYMARFFVLKDVFYQSKPAVAEHLRSQYLVFTANFHGDLDTWLWDLWDSIEADVRRIWGHCVAFHEVDSADDFVAYIKKCQIKNALLFQGSTDEPLAVQLKSLYLKQRFGDFVVEHQGLADDALHRAFTEFLQQVELDNLRRPTWRAGVGQLDAVEVR